MIANGIRHATRLNTMQLRRILRNRNSYCQSLRADLRSIYIIVTVDMYLTESNHDCPLISRGHRNVITEIIYCNYLLIPSFRKFVIDVGVDLYKHECIESIIVYKASVAV